jgi:hypothetical protein
MPFARHRCFLESQFADSPTKFTDLFSYLWLVMKCNKQNNAGRLEFGILRLKLRNDCHSGGGFRKFRRGWDEVWTRFRRSKGALLAMLFGFAKRTGRRDKWFRHSETLGKHSQVLWGYGYPCIWLIVWKWRESIDGSGGTTYTRKQCAGSKEFYHTCSMWAPLVN